MAMVLKAVRVKNPPARPRRSGRGKLTPAQLAAGFGGKRRMAAATKPRAKQVSKPAHRRRVVARRKNIAEIVHIGLGNPAPKRGIQKVAKKGRVKKNTAVRRRAVAQKRRNPANGRTVFAKRTGRKHRQQRNPAITANISTMLQKAAWTVGGLVGARGLTQFAFTAIKNPAANSGVLGYVSNIVAAFVLGGVVGKFRGKEAGSAVTIGGLAGVVARAVTEYAPGGQFVRAQLSGLGDYGLGLYLPTQYAVPGVPVDPNSIEGGATMQNPWPQLPAPPAPANGVGRLADAGLGGRYSAAGRYN